MTNSPKDLFEHNRYLVVRKFVDPTVCSFLASYFKLLNINGRTKSDPQVPNAATVYGEMGFETLLWRSTAQLSELIGIPLFPTYSYGRIYREGNELKPHKDRSECEISMTLHLGHESDSIWPIFLRDKNNNEIKCDLDVGDVLIYRGAELDHWRNPFSGDYWMQLFLHYVDANGQYKDTKYDGRTSLGAAPIKPEQVQKHKLGLGSGN